MSTFHIKLSDGVYHVVGFIDDSADFAPILAAPPPVRINWRQVSGINSSGVEHFLGFTGQWDGKRVDYLECPDSLVHAFLMLPSLLGPASNTANIVSLYTPYECASCGLFCSLLVESRELTMGDEVLVFPVRKCPKCQAPLEPEGVADDFIALADQGALNLITRPAAPGT